MNFLDRLNIELKDLNEKLVKLEDFIKSEEFKNLNDKNQFLLYEQKIHMKNYKETLEKRIKINE